MATLYIVMQHRAGWTSFTVSAHYSYDDALLAALEAPTTFEGTPVWHDVQETILVE